MARLNIEDCWWTDPRRSALISIFGNEELADARAIRAWKLAQDFWKHDRKLVPVALFELLPGHEMLIQVGLAEVRESFVYVRGSSAYLDWAAERRVQAREAGKKSARVRREKTGSAQPKRRTNSEQNPTTSNPLSLSPSLSLSPALKKKEEPSGGSEVAVATPASLESPVSEFIKTYVMAYGKKYPGSRPEITGKVQGQIKAMLKSVPLARATNLVQVYCQMDVPWFLTKSHDFTTFFENLNVIGRALDTGQNPSKATTPIDWGKVFEAGNT